MTQKAEAENEIKSESTDTGLGTILVEHKEADGIIAVTVTVTWKNRVTTDDGIDISLKDEAENSLKKISTDVSHTGTNITTGSTIFLGVNGKNISRGKKYTIFVSAWMKDSDENFIKDNGEEFIKANPIVVDILNVQNQKAEDIKKGTYNPTDNFICELSPWPHVGGERSWSGCFTGIFNIIFKIASALFAGAGMFFDWLVGYSLDSNSYRSAFVTEGWGIVRDMCNVFFIFILLYVAFATVLNLHGFKTKEMIVNVVIIGLLINFSLFATHVIIDTSNILARVFYNNVEVNVDTNSNGTNTVVAGVDTGIDKNLTSDLGEKHLSAALISKVNPQKIIQNAGSFDVKNGSATNSDNVTAQTYLIITFLSIVMCILGIIVFLSVGLIFLARVIGLWLAMILVPLTFFSYTVPALQDIDMVGWKKWWPETLKLAFLAPVFMFFMYIIIKFLDTGLGMFKASNQTGFQFVLSVIIPFAFLMVLLWKAKGVAKTMSGELGQQITGALAATAGLALGGAALGTAFLGRKVIGQTMARASRGETATQKYEAGKATGVGKVTGWVGSKLKLGRVFGNTRDANGTINNGIGSILNERQKKVNEIEHGRHELESLKEKAHLKDVSDENLSGENIKTLKTTYTKDKKGEIEADIRKGAKPLEDENGVSYAGGESGFKSAKRAAVTSKMMIDDPDSIDKNGELTKEAEKRVEDQLTVQFNAALKISTDKASEAGFAHLQEEAKRQISIGDRLVSKSNTGTYDVRNISQSKTDKREGILTKIGVGAAAGIALAIRTGLKKTVDVNHGTGQGNFLKDLGHTFTEAMKSAKVDVKVSAPHGGGDHGGGHDAHGGGGHH